ncbi:hypothetical protein ZYGR_0N06810 [Zygosaccharomyces rouxii]|uniref:ZYRO0D15906p n=2 Tax=Zygosaccharomyces rouxii TaxID=4956 RepID=C5DWM0_ZYGRC|nr:uncharacterized protein ZYRO0D15906g [Zygosaccharomyces rouxii]KAH9201100.1 hypothetical protein LQ764DRAFT_209450 [Zygosaccharomyces rouxii]GAV49274.1 hypothetical protein ZYGR_0N06810 [Zygosaccharomyces rouxii]CAR28189.1 ZYRO0D15906p [Zygosaccharomyces rouxii]
MGLKKIFSSVRSNNSVKSSDHSESEATVIDQGSSEFESNESLNFQFESEKTDSACSTAIPEETGVYPSIPNSPSDPASEHVVYSDDDGSAESPIQDSIKVINGLNLSVDFDPQFQNTIVGLDDIEEFKSDYCALKKEDGKLASHTSELTSNNKAPTPNNVSIRSLAKDLRKENFGIIELPSKDSISRKMYDKVVKERLETFLVNRELKTEIAALSQLVVSLNHIHNDTMRNLQIEAFRAQTFENALITTRHQAEAEKAGLHQVIDNLTETNEELTAGAEKMKCGYEEIISELIKQRIDDLQQLKSRTQADKLALENAQRLQREKLNCMSLLNNSQGEDHELQRSAQRSDQRQSQDLQAHHEELIKKFCVQ